MSTGAKLDVTDADNRSLYDPAALDDPDRSESHKILPHWLICIKILNQ